MHEASFYKQDGERVTCQLCPYECVVSNGRRGVCGVRECKEGKLYSLVYGFPCSMAVDPIEKKPLYHFLPGEKVFSIATVGCNLSCKWCQNWEISHPENKEVFAPYGEVSPEEIITSCKKESCSILAFTYTEPTIFYEYMLAIAKLAKEAGIRTVLVSNGYIEEEPLRELIPFLDAANIDLKALTEEDYKKWTGASQAPVLRTLKILKQEGVWLEVTTLIVPGVNDEGERVEALYGWIQKELGRDQVVHISRFFPYYKVKDKPPTPLATLARVERVAKKHLKYVYVGNVRWKNKFSSGKGVPGIWK